MSFIEAAQIDQIPAGSMKSCSIGGKQILIANVEGEFYAINNTCTHAGGDLSKGKLEGKIVTCPKHGAMFDVTTGKCITGPKIGLLKLNAKDETAFEVKVEEDKILVAGA